jgi:deoxyguanosine kinase
LVELTERLAHGSPLIAIAGPIAAGKSTLTISLAAALGFSPWLERVDANPYFARFCSDQKRWALRSQMAFMLGAIEDALAARSGRTGSVLERPVEEMFGVFCEDQFGEGILSVDEYQMLRRLRDLGRELVGSPDVLVALDGPPELLLRRIRDRDRMGEDRYDLDYVDRLVRRQRAWVANWDAGPVIHVDIESRALRDEVQVQALAGEVLTALSEEGG